MISRRYRLGGQLSLDLLHQDAKLGRDLGVFVQQISEPGRPPLGLTLLSHRQRRTSSDSELIMSLTQPPLSDLSLPAIAAADQFGEPPPRRFPHISNRGLRNRLASELRQSHENIPGHTTTPSTPPKTGTAKPAGNQDTANTRPTGQRPVPK
jgi:hypothetical protein